jgi:hypothetical protein
MDESTEVISEPWRLAAERSPERETESVPPPEEDATPLQLDSPGDAPEEDAAPLQLDLHADAPVEEAVPLQLDSPADATVYMSREDVEAALHGPKDGLPRFELGEPGTGLEDMKVDMRPDAPRAFELGPPVDDELGADEGHPADPAEEPQGADAADLDRTARVSREELESALSQPEPKQEPWDPPENLDGMIASFNARHVVLFRAVRAEIGAGAANFVRSCRSALEPRFADMFATAEIRADGSWDPAGLKSSVIEHRISEAADGFGKLLDGELQRLRAHLGDARASALAGQLTEIP